MHFRLGTPALLSGVIALSMFTGACATKKHVREQIAPVQQQVSDVQKTTKDHTAAIGDLDRNVAKVNEAAMEADRKAGAAAQSAERAQSAANQAQTAANSASTAAQQAMTRAGEIEKNLGNLGEKVENIDNYQLVTTEKVYFRVNRYELTKEEKEKLDQAVQQIQSMKHYVIEIAGYTDKTGSQAANLELSRRRADAVVRYLNVQHNIPLRRIHDVGAGADFPDADNKTRAARKENRRVDIRIYSLDGAKSGPQTSSLGTPTTQP